MRLNNSVYDDFIKRVSNIKEVSYKKRKIMKENMIDFVVKDKENGKVEINVLMSGKGKYVFEGIKNRDKETSYEVMVYDTDSKHNKIQSLLRISKSSFLLLVVIFLLGFVASEIFIQKSNFKVVGGNEYISKDEVEELMMELTDLGYVFNKNIVINVSEKSSSKNNAFFVYNNLIPYISYIQLNNNYIGDENAKDKTKSDLLHELGHYFEIKLDKEEQKMFVDTGRFEEGVWNNNSLLFNSAEKKGNEWNGSLREVFAEDLRTIMSYELGLLNINQDFGKEEKVDYVTINKTYKEEKADKVSTYFLNNTGAETLSISELQETYSKMMMNIKK